MKKASSILLLVLVIFAVVAVIAKPLGNTNTYRQCLINCKKSLRHAPTDCFSQCAVHKRTEKNMACSIPNFNLACNAAPLVAFQGKNTNASRPLRSNKALDEELSDQAAAPLNTEALWRTYHAELVKFLSRRQNPTSAQGFAGLQLLPMALPAEWDSDDRQFQIIANRRSKFQMSHETILGYFEQNYCELFVPNLQFKTDYTPAQEAIVKDLYAKQDLLTDKLFVEVCKCEDRYYALNQNYREQRFKDYNDYASKSCSSLMLATRELSVVKGEIEKYYVNYAGGRKELEAREAILKCGRMERLNKERKFFELNPLKDFLQDIKNGKMSPFSIDMSKSSYTASEQSSYKGFGVNLVVLNVDKGKSMKHLKTAAKDFDLKISAKSFTAIHIAPEAEWFNGDVISFYKNGPFRNNKNPSHFFGESGSINQMPRSLYIVYQPSIEFCLNQQDFEEFETITKTSATATIYCVSFSFGSSRVMTKRKIANGMTCIKIEDRDNSPQLIAMNNIIL